MNTCFFRLFHSFCHIYKLIFLIAKGTAFNMHFQLWILKEINFLHSDNSICSVRYRPLSVVVAWWYVVEKFDKILSLTLKSFIHAHNVSWSQFFISLPFPSRFSTRWTPPPSQHQVLFISKLLNHNLCCLYTHGCATIHRMCHRILKTYYYIIYF